MAKVTSSKGTVYDPDKLEKQAAKLVKKFNKIGEDLDSAVMVALEEIGIKIEGDAVRLAPKDTGLLQKSIAHATYKYYGGGKTVVGTNVEYAPYVEFGLISNKNYPKQPYLTPALDMNKEFIKSKLKDATTNVVNNAKVSDSGGE